MVPILPFNFNTSMFKLSILAFAISALHIRAIKLSSAILAFLSFFIFSSSKALSLASCSAFSNSAVTTAFLNSLYVLLYFVKAFSNKLLLIFFLKEIFVAPVNLTLLGYLPLILSIFFFKLSVVCSIILLMSATSNLCYFILPV